MHSFIQSIVNSNPALLIALGSLLTSLILQGVKKLLSTANDKVITALHIAVGMSVAAIDYLLQSNPHTPALIAVNGFLLMGASSPVYRYIVKPSYKALEDVRELRAIKKVNANATTITVTPPIDVAPAEFNA